MCDENDAAEPSNEYTKWDCARRCYDTPTCVAWLFKEAATPHTCWLKTSTDCSQPESGSVWGTRECGNHVPGTIKYNVVIIDFWVEGQIGPFIEFSS